MNKEDRKRRDTLIAAAVTMGAALGLLILLFCGSLRYDKALLAQASTPEIGLMPEEEPAPELIEPEILAEKGDLQPEVKDAPSTAVKGNPEPAPKPNPRAEVPGRNEKPAPAVEKPVAQEKPSPVKATEPTKSDRDRQKVTDKMVDKFPGPNGSRTGSSSGRGSGGTGVGTSGQLNGRTFKGCPSPRVELQNKVVVEVKVTVDAAGRVTAATARSKTGKASGAILAACEQAACQARWSEDPDTPSARGTITFTITPK